jgi:hypothetical protein
MSERGPSLNPEQQRERDYEKAQRLADDLRKLERGVISEADEATQIARQSLHHMRVAVKKRLNKKKKI